MTVRFEVSLYMHSYMPVVTATSQHRALAHALVMRTVKNLRLVSALGWTSV